MIPINDDFASGLFVAPLNIYDVLDDPDPEEVGVYDSYFRVADPLVTNKFYIYFKGGFENISSATRQGTGCFRQNHSVADGTCITASAADKNDPSNVPQSLFEALAEFDEAPNATLNNAFGAGVTEVQLHMENNLPAPLFRVDVDWDFNIKLDFSGYKTGQAPRYNVTGSHDAFPLFTVHIGEQLVYGFDGILAGNSALSLLSRVSVLSASEAGLLLKEKPFSGEIENFPISREIRLKNLTPLIEGCH